MDGTGGWSDLLPALILSKPSDKSVILFGGCRELSDWRIIVYGFYIVWCVPVRDKCQGRVLGPVGIVGGILSGNGIGCSLNPAFRLREPSFAGE